MQVWSREYHSSEDYERIRQLLIECYIINQTMHCWGLERLDWWRFNIHADNELSGSREWHNEIRMWETEKGKLVGVAHPEGGLRPRKEWGDIFLEVHPDFRWLEDEMLEWAEQHHIRNRPCYAEKWPLKTWVYDYDKTRGDLLSLRGYRNLGQDRYKRRCSLVNSIPAVNCPEDYAVRTVDEKDMEKWATLIRDTFDNPMNTAERSRVWLSTPTPHCDLVAVAPNGEFAAFCIVWFDKDSNIGMFEPVGTHPAHRRLGLGKVVMSEGLKWLKSLGVTMAYVGTGTGTGANRLYEAVGFTEYDIEFCWEKEF